MSPCAPTAALKRDRTLCSQRCAHAGKALYLDQREDFKGQESRTEREQLDKGHWDSYKRPCYSQQTKKEEEKKKQTKKYRNTHTATTEVSGSLLGEITSCTVHEEKTGSLRGRQGSPPG